MTARTLSTIASLCMLTVNLNLIRRQVVNCRMAKHLAIVANLVNEVDEPVDRRLTRDATVITAMAALSSVAALATVVVDDPARTVLGCVAAVFANLVATVYTWTASVITRSVEANLRGCTRG